MNEEQFIGTIIGCAIGDTLGMPVEGWKKEQIARYAGRITEPRDPVIVKDKNGKIVYGDEFGYLKYHTKYMKKGEWTDDTILTLAIAEAIAENGLDLEAIAEYQLKEYKSRIQKDGSVRGGFGRTTIGGFENMERVRKGAKTGVVGGPGNAPAMKAGPLGLAAESEEHMIDRYDDRRTFLTSDYVKFVEDVAKMTHLDPRSVRSGVIQANAINNLLDGANKGTFMTNMYLITMREEKVPKHYSYSSGPSLFDKIGWVMTHAHVSPNVAHKKLGSSSLVTSSYPFAVFMFQKYWDNPIEGLIETVNYGGDCDTTGAIYGALAGAKNGMIFPKEWVDVLYEKERLINAGKNLWRQRNEKSIANL
ncbi:MAG: ADP-ribosylglycohydrolase family protein [archaeon]